VRQAQIFLTVSITTGRIQPGCDWKKSSQCAARMGVIR
jgi:hypothetical protein